MLKNWNTDKIIGAGLTLAVVLIVLGSIITMIAVQQTILENLASNVVSALGGYMGRSLLEKQKLDEELKK